MPQVYGLRPADAQRTPADCDGRDDYDDGDGRMVENCANSICIWHQC